MEPTEQDGARLLAPLREARPGTPSAVNVHRAIHVGARRVRIRRVATTVAVVGVAAVIVAVVPTITNGLMSNEPVAPAAARFDVLRQSFTVGSAGGFTPVSYETGRYRQRIALRLADEDAQPGKPDRATVTMYAGGREPRGEPSPDVNGRRALWVPTDGKTELAWEWADRAWGFAEVNAVGEDALARVHRVAQSVAPGADVAVTAPFTVPMPAAGDPGLVGVITPYGTSSDVSSAALLVFAVQDAVLTDGSEVDRVLLGVQRDPTSDVVSGEPRQAARDTAVTTGLTDGFFAVAEVSSTELLDRLGGRQRLAELANSIRLVSDPTDHTTWTDQPLR